MATGTEHGEFTIPTSRINQVAPTQVVDVAELYNHRRPTTNFAGRLAKLLFFSHLIATVILISFLSIAAFVSPSLLSFHFLLHWHAPLLVAAAASAAISLLFLFVSLRHPATAIKSSFWLSPVLACAVAVILLADGTALGLAFAVPFLLLALIQSLHACWTARRLRHAYAILSAAVASVPPSFALVNFLSLSLLALLAFFALWTLGAGGVAAGVHSRYDAVYLILLLIGLWWTAQAVRYTVFVAVAQIAYLRLACGITIPAAAAFESASKRALGDVCCAAALVPLVAATRAVARAMSAGGSDEFMFSCGWCFKGVADGAVARANRWGLVYVGVYGRGLWSSSAEAWEMFNKQGMERLIDLDLTGSFCLFCGVAGGGVSTLVAGSWMIAAGSDHSTEAKLYAFIIGYFMARIGMAWPQACVAAYHVVFAENPQMSSCIGARMRELQQSSSPPD
ncbi:uncharacterized protein LOC122052442 [Zingiber officinale]|nr:uncharacterized protein LOC122052442 [Zingiber officinale]